MCSFTHFSPDLVFTNIKSNSVEVEVKLVNSPQNVISTTIKWRNVAVYVQ